MPPDLPRQRRRAGLYARRGLSTLPGRGLRRPCVFLHLPKCGGTSLAAALYGTVPLHRRVGVIDALATRRAAALSQFGWDDPMLCHEDLPAGHITFALREQALLTHLCWGTPLIHGHVFLSERARDAGGTGHGWVTMMRDPAERAVSNYRMAVRAGVIPDDPDAWLDGSVGRSMAQVNLRYLTGRNRIDPGQEAEAAAIARDRLGWFELIGFLDDPAGFARGFARRFGPRLPMPRYNRGAGPEVRLTAAQRDRLEALVAPDREVYDAARRLFGRAAAGRLAGDPGPPRAATGAARPGPG